MSGIEKYFNKDSWKQFSGLYQEPKDSEQFELLLQKVSDRELARVIWGRMEEHSMIWINHKIPALEGLRPLDCLSAPELLNRLRECLLRMD